MVYSFADYQRDAAITAIYPEHGEQTERAINYCVLGFAGEAGETANKWKKHFRDDFGPTDYQGGRKPTPERRDAMLKEIGGALWYAANLATELNVDLGDIASYNIAELQSRQQRGTLRGDGDNR